MPRSYRARRPSLRAIRELGGAEQGVEVRAEAVKLARSSQKLLSEVAGDLAVAAETLRNWLKQQQIDAGKRDGLTTDEREEMKRLWRENKVLKEERVALRKATAFFASEENNTRRRR